MNGNDNKLFRMGKLFLNFFIAIAVALPILTSCTGKGFHRANLSHLELRSVTEKEVIAGINRPSKVLQGLSAKLNLILIENGNKKESRCNGILLALNKDHSGIYLKGYRRLLPTFFTMVSNDEKFWFHIPSRNVVYTGPKEFARTTSDSIKLYLTASDLFRAIFTEPLESGCVWNISKEDTNFVVKVYEDNLLKRQIWIEGRGLNAIRETFFDNRGNAQLTIHRDRYVDLDGYFYPAYIMLNDVGSGYSVSLDFNTITLNPENLSMEAFTFNIPGNAKVISVDT
jgi:outer membrane lipoprotein-sorting protein